MPGQPQSPGVFEFDVTGLEVSWEQEPTAPTFIVQAGKDFRLKATFEGTPGGIWWNQLKGDSEEYRVGFYAEGLGPDPEVKDQNLGHETGTLDARDTYPVEHGVAGGIAEPGVYKMACVVTFPGVFGVAGFYDQLIVQVYQD